MAFAVVEHWTSGSETVGGFSGNDGDAELVCHVLECNSPLLARAAVLYIAPATYHGLFRGPVSLTPMSGNIWKVTIKYQKIQNKMSITMDTHCEKHKRLHSINTISNTRVRYAGNVSLPAPDFKKLIGVDKNKVEGVECYEGGSFKFTVSWSTTFGALQGDYIYTVLTMGATVNESAVLFTWKNQIFQFAKGTLLFTGGTFHDTTGEGCDISLKFEGRLNEDDLVIGDLNGQTVATMTGTISNGSPVISGLSSTEDLRPDMKVASLVPGAGIPDDAVIDFVIDETSVSMLSNATATGSITIVFSNAYFPHKEGWWYLWLRTKKVRGAAGTSQQGLELEVPDSGHLEQVYKYADFSLLRIFDTITNQEAEISAALTDAQNAEQGAGGAGFQALPDGFGNVGGLIGG